MSTSSQVVRPIVVGPNQPDRPYRGGAGIARFRGAAQPHPFASEDFVGSAVEVRGGGAGLTRLPDGRLLRDAIHADPAGWLGDAHAARFGDDPRLLVKLLDTGQRLFVHLHPDDAFARARLGTEFGKTEAWIVVATRDEGVDSAAVWLGFHDPVSQAEVDRWVEEQDHAALLGAMNRFEVSAGDTILVPAGTAHAIGPGITLVELQQPVDLSILLEWRGFPKVDPADAFLGLPRDVAMGALDTGALGPDALAALRGRSTAGEPLLAAAASRYFRADRLDDGDLAPASFGVIVVTAGDGSLEAASGRIPVRAGETVVWPYAAGGFAVRGVTIIHCRPPAPHPEEES